MLNTKRNIDKRAFRRLEARLLFKRHEWLSALMEWTASFQRSNSHDKVRKIVAEEGRAARNLIAWSVPLENKEEEGKSKVHSNARSQRINSGQHRNKKQPAGLECKAAAGAMLEKGAEKSPTKARQPRKIDLRARYWAFLFDNLRRAVDEIYVTCESDQSVVECKEVLMMLDNYVRDFKALIDWIQLQEKLEKTDAQNRPTSLAWEVRKMSPGRHVMSSPTTDRIVPSPGVRRSLNFGGPPPTLAVARLSHSGPSWADRVKSSQALPAPGQTTGTAEKPGKTDAEGWETVQRGRSMRSRSVAMVAKVSPVLAHVSPKAGGETVNGQLPAASRGTLDLRFPSFESVAPRGLGTPLSHSLSQEHLSLKKYIVDVVTDSTLTPESPRDREEKQKARKKAKKLRARMNSRAKEYETSMESKMQILDSPYKAKLQRLVKDLGKQLQGQDSGQWASNKVSGLDRTLGEISRILEKQNNADQVAFQVGGGLSALEQILQVVMVASTPTAVPRIPLRSLCTAVNVYYLACSHCSTNCCYVFYSNRIAPLLDLVLHQLTLYVPDEDRSIFGRGVNKQVFEGLITGLLQTTAAVLSLLHPSGPEAGRTSPRSCSPDAKSKPAPSENFTTRAQDLLSYVVNMGLLDKLYGCFLSVQGPIDESPKISAFLEQATSLLHATCKLCFSVMGRSASIFDDKRQDATGLTPLLQSLDLVGVLHMLYCILLHSGLPEPQGAGPAMAPELYGPTVVRVALQALRFLNCYALLNLAAFQSVLGAEGLSLAFRHIVSSLLWYCSQNSSEELLHEIIICVGYFTVNHPDNQVIVQSGRQPSVLQKLCQLPFQYFSHPRLIRVLFPTLISACYDNPHNKVILKQEMSCVLLATFIQVQPRPLGRRHTRARTHTQFFSRGLRACSQLCANACLRPF
uniref:S phase cyclin A-associated protein in the endoplasmic reticulum N-terminal domain-containing protein n=1 Tax=Electrophorus electricus TaxID=8005 RepID=A0A4W4GBI2_ELEEL